MDEPARNEPHVGANPYAYPGAGAPAAPPAAPLRASPADSNRYPVEFTALAGEYFRIWIVNLALTILTLGIYSAWAKVRKKRYFYSHTRIDGDSFEYRGNPIAILKGRIIAVVIFTAYSFGGQISPLLGGLCAIALVFAMPWLIIRSLAFNAYNSAYRNIRFNFRGRYWQPFRLLLGGGLLVILTLGFGYPYLKARLVQFVARNHAYGATSFELGKVAGSFYGIYFKAFGLLLLSFAVLGIAAGVTGSFKGLRGGLSAGIVMVMIGAYAAYLLVFAYVHARTTNVIWNGLVVGPVHFECTLGARKLAGIYLVNIVAIVLTLGLATPWAAVRTMRYRAEKMAIISAGELAEFVAAEAGNVSATGEEVGELFDIDFGL